MPNKCTKCATIHGDDDPYLLARGCTKCGSKFFFYVRQELIDQLENIEKDVEHLSQKEMKEIEQDVREIANVEDETIILDVESIRVEAPGKYKIDVTTLFKQKPIVIRTAKGRYLLDLSSLLKKKETKKAS